MNSLYLENSIIGSLFRFFSPYFSTATQPTRFLLTWLVIAQVALQAFPSLRFLHRNFLSQVTHRCLNSSYRALQNETVTSHSLRLQTAQLACSLIPAALQNEPVFLSVDDTTVPKFGKKFDAVSLLHDHACHTGKPYVVVKCCIITKTIEIQIIVYLNRSGFLFFIIDTAACKAASESPLFNKSSNRCASVRFANSLSLFIRL